MSARPKIYTKESEKFAIPMGCNVPDFFRDNISYYETSTANSNSTTQTIVGLYGMYNNKLYIKDYEATINPHNVKSEYLTRLNSLLKNYDIISPVINRKIGDFLRRGDFLRLMTNSDQDDNLLAEKVSKFMEAKITEEFTNQSKVINTEGKSSNGLDYQALAEEFYEQTYASLIVKRNSAILQDLKLILNLTFKWAVMLEDYFVCGRCMSYKGVHNDQLVYQPGHPLDVTFIGMSNLSFLGQYSEAARADYYLSFSELEDLFGDKECFKKSRNAIEKLFSETTFGEESNSQFFFNQTDNYVGSFGVNRDTLRTNVANKKLVRHITFRGRKQVKHLKYYDEYGDVSYIDVEYDYELDKDNGDISFEDKWIDVYYYAWYVQYSLVDTIANTREGQYGYLDYGCGNILRNDKGSMLGEPLPYNGIVRGFNPDNVMSDVKAGVPYASTYNSIMYRADVTMNRMISNLTVIPMSLIPQGEGWGEEKFLHYMRTFETLFVDDSTPEAVSRINYIKSLNLAGYEHVLRLYEIAENIKNQYWERVGFNRQVMGQTSSSDLNGVTRMAVNQATAADTWQLYVLDKLLESEVQGLIDLMQVLKVDGWQSKVLLSKNDEFIINMPGEQVLSTDMRVYVSASPQEAQKVDIMRQNALSLMQNSGNIKAVAEVVDAETMEDIKDLLRKADKEQKQLDEIVRKQQQEIEKYVADKGLEAAETKKSESVEVAHINADAKIEVAKLTVEGFNNADAEPDDEADVIGTFERADQRAIENRKMQEEQRRQRVAELQKREALDIQKAKAAQSSKPK